MLRGSAHFTLEQMDRVIRFLNLAPMEAEFLLFMIQRDRSGTASLRAFFEERMEEVRTRHLNLKTRVQLSEVLGAAEQSRYYSSWHYAAIHIAVTSDELRTVESLAARLAMPRKQVAEAVTFLERCGLILNEKGKLKTGPSQLHLEKSSPLLPKHHWNWRVQAMRPRKNGRFPCDLLARVFDVDR